MIVIRLHELVRTTSKNALFIKLLKVLISMNYLVERNLIRPIPNSTSLNQGNLEKKKA